MAETLYRRDDSQRVRALVEVARETNGRKFEWDVLIRHQEYLIKGEKTMFLIAFSIISLAYLSIFMKQRRGSHE